MAERGGDSRETVPAFPALHPHHNSAAVTWYPEWKGWGQKRRDFFWVLRIASSSSSLSSQLLRRRCAPSQGARTQGAWDQPLGAPGAGDAGAAGDTCGSSRWQPSPGRQQREPRQPWQLQSPRPEQPRLRSRSLMLLPAPGPADPGGCGFSASQQLFADCSGFQVRRWRGRLPGQTRSCHLAKRPCSKPQCAQLWSALRWGYPAGVWCWKLRPKALDWDALQVPRCRRAESSRLARLLAAAAWGSQSGIQSREWGGSLSWARQEKGRQASNLVELSSVCGHPRERRR